MSVVRYQSASSMPVKHGRGHGHGHSRMLWGVTASYPTPGTTVLSSPPGLEFQRKPRFAMCSPPAQAHSTPPSDRLQPEQKHNPVPKSFEIISPSGKKQTMVFVERVSHITTMVEYGLIPADSKERKYDEKGVLVGNEGMELLSPKVYEDTVQGTFFFAERRPRIQNEQKEKQKQEKKDQGKDRKKNKDAKKEDEDSPKIPTLLEQLVKLRVLKIIPTVRCKSIQHSGACLVRILLSDNEVSPPHPLVESLPRANWNSQIAHSCSSPRHSYFLYEAPGYTRFKVLDSFMESYSRFD